MPVLAKSEIEKRLDRGEIFLGTSWERDRIRSAAYDLRIAPDYLVAPDGMRYWPGGKAERRTCDEAIVLEPGDIAFVSSVEQVGMPLDLAGNIAQKFEWTRQGLLVMGGLLVDPGYGLELGDDGTWRAKPEGERLHFPLANIGAEDLTLLPGRDTIAGIQFLTLTGTVTGEGEGNSDIYVPSSTELLDSLFDRGNDDRPAPLAFFSRTRDLEKEVHDLRAQGKEHGIKLEATRRSTELVVVFGIFLIAISLFTVAVAALIEGLSGGSIDALFGTDGEVELTWTAFVVAAVVLAIVGFACAVMMRPVIDVVRRYRRDQKDEGSGEG